MPGALKKPLGEGLSSLRKWVAWQWVTSGRNIQPEQIQQQGWRHYQGQQARNGADTVKQVFAHLNMTPFLGDTNSFYVSPPL